MSLDTVDACFGESHSQDIPLSVEQQVMAGTIAALRSASLSHMHLQSPFSPRERADV